MHFKWGGAQVYIDFLFFFMLSLMLCYNSTATLMMLSLSFLHESGHIAALLLLGGKVKSLHVSAFGMVMVPASSNLTLYQECIYILAGPFVNVILSFGLLALHMPWAQQMSALSLLLGLFNLLPVSALDGGKALWYFLLMHVREETVIHIVRIVSVTSLCLLGVFGLFLLLQNHRNFSVLFIVVYLTILFIQKPMN